MVAAEIRQKINANKQKITNTSVHIAFLQDCHAD